MGECLRLQLGCVLLGLKYKGTVLVFTTVASPVILRAPLIGADFVAPVSHGRAVLVSCSLLSANQLKKQTKTRECL